MGKVEVKLVLGDCLEKMSDIPDGSIDMVISDVPYGITECSWDSEIPLEPMWEQVERVVKGNGAILLFGVEPFASKLVMSNEKLFRYDLIWIKTASVGFLNAGRMPLRAHENILVFYKSLPTYNPQKEIVGDPYFHRKRRGQVASELYKQQVHKPIVSFSKNGERYPVSWFIFPKDGYLHPTQKPVALLEYLIKMYTNEGDTVLDFTMGSGSTGVACVRTRRNFIGIEIVEKYVEIAKKRILDAMSDLFLGECELAIDYGGYYQKY